MLHPASVGRPPENNQTFLARAYLKTGTNATFFGKRPCTQTDRPKTIKPRTWT